MKEFLELYPEVEVSLMLLDSELDLGMRQADCAIRFNPPRQPDLIQRPLLAVKSRLYASPDYLKQHGIPMTPEDLDEHRLIVYGEDLPQPVSTINWLLTVAHDGPPRRPVLKVNNIYGMFRSVVSGLGIAALPSYMSRLTSNLVQVVPSAEGPTTVGLFWSIRKSCAIRSESRFYGIFSSGRSRRTGRLPCRHGPAAAA